MEAAYKALKNYYSKLLLLNTEELNLVERYFVYQPFPKNTMVFTEGSVFNCLLFIARGAVRHFYNIDGYEKTCDFSFADDVVTDMASFTSGAASNYNLQAMEATAILKISKENLQKLYKLNPKYETAGRLMAQQGTIRITALATLHTRYNPRERYLILLRERPDLFNRIPLKYIAQYLGILPESLSRMRKQLLLKS